MAHGNVIKEIVNEDKDEDACLVPESGILIESRTRDR